jgi:glycosyltransferase involved in cell wall biosynthesis
MPDTKPSVLFVTDELFLPAPHNGSADLYLRVARDYARDGYETFCLSFFRDRRQASASDVLGGYSQLFADFLLIPWSNGGGSPIGMISWGLRAIFRWVSGNVFSMSPLQKRIQNSHQKEIVKFVRQRNVGTIYFHKPETLLLLRDVLPILRPAMLILDLHDDFVERELQFGRVCKAFFSSVGPKEVVREYLTIYLRYRFSRLNVGLSRRTETDLLAACDQVWISSQEEYERYRLRPRLKGKVVHQPRRFVRMEPGRRVILETRFHAGLIGGAEIMTLDALLWFCEEVLPRIRRVRPDFRLLIAGPLARQGGPRIARGRDQVRFWTFWPWVDDLTTFYNSIELAVAPLRYGTGTSVRVLEAMSFGCPIVSTSVGVRGLSSEELTGVSVADDPDAFAAYVIETISSELPLIES